MVSRLKAGRSISRNILFNFGGESVPILVALVAIPILVHSLGKDRFGLLTLAWAVVGYFGIFDLGLGRALTKLVADKIGENKNDEIAPLVGTGLFLLLLLGICGGALMAGITPWLSDRALKIPVVLRGEAVETFYLLAISFPLAITTSGLRGVLAAYQRFDLINAVRVPQGTLAFLAPLCVLPFSHNLAIVTGSLILVRVATWWTYGAICLRVVPHLRPALTLRRDLVRPLLSFGGWITVSNAITPMVVYFDRFFIGAVLSMTAVAYYATPFDVVSKLSLLPAAVVGVLFPAFAENIITNRARAAALYRTGIKCVFLALFPAVLVIITLAPEGLHLWLGAGFSVHSTRVLQWLAAGVLINGVAYLPYALIQAAHRPDLTAKFHLVELPPYLVLLWWLAHLWGIQGAAIASAIRTTVDAILCFAGAAMVLPDFAASANDFVRLLIAVVTPLLLVAALIPADLVVKGLFLALVLPVTMIAGWFWLFSADERISMRAILRLA